MNKLYEKICLIHNEGIFAFKRDSVKPFNGFSEETIGNRFFVGMRFDSLSEWSVLNKMIQPILNLERNLCNTRFYSAMRDFPFHSTVLEGKYEGSDLMERNHIFREISWNKEFIKVCKNVKKVEINFPYLAIDKSGAVFIATDEIPSRVIETREVLSKLYERYGLTPLPIVDLLHCTIARIMEFPELKKQYSLFEWIMEAARFSTSEPMRLKTLDAMSMRAYEFFS